MGRLLYVVVLAALCGVARADDGEHGWIYNLAANLLSYGILVAPAALAINYFNKNPEKMAGNSMFARYTRNFVVGNEVEEQKPKQNGDLNPEEPERAPQSLLMQALVLIFHVVGLQGSYLIWGVLQEQIMTQPYGENADGDAVYFKNSQFLVFVNRVLALVVAWLIVVFTKQPPHSAPFYAFGYCSLSNVMSSFCQYEALRYIDFPTQLLGKACKVIPVMILGKYVQNKTYPMHEYIMAGLISVGVAMFMFSKAEDEGKLDEDDDVRSTSLAGLFLMAGYLTFDSFTSNYQSRLFKDYKMSAYSMMLGVNVFSTLFTLWSLLQQGTFFACMDFLFKYPQFMFHAVLLSITSATGQIFIFRTLSIFGTLVFSLVMVTRQVFSLFLSALFFGHTFKAMGWFGILLVFAALFARIYLNRK